MKSMRAALGLALSLVVLALPAGSAAAPTWLASQDLSEVGQDANLPQVAADQAGDVFAVWQRYNGVNWVVDAIRRPAGGAWGAPHEFSIAGQELSGPQIAVNPAGDAVAVWTRSGANAVVQAARRPAGGDWSDAQDISVLAEDGGIPKVAVDPSGTATAIWEARSGSTYVIETSRQPAGGSWSAPEVISAAGDQAEAPDLAVDAAGDATAVWVRSAGSDWIVQAASRPAGGPWSAPQDLSPEATRLVPKVAVDRAGDAVAVWLRSTWIVRASERPAGGSWSAPQSLSLTGGEASQPEVAMDSAGDAVAVWLRFDGANQVVQARRRGAGGGWGTRFDLSAPGQNALAPQVALDDAGHAVAVWVRYNDAGKQIVQTAREPGPSAWDATQDLSSLGEDAGDPQVALDAAGNGVSAWDVSDGSHTIVQAAGLDAVGPTLSGLSIPSHGTAGKRLSFSLSSAFDVWSPPTAPPEWFFGDGASATGTKVTHAYESGTYRVTVSQADAVGNVTSSSSYVAIDPARCFVPRVVGLTLKRARAAIRKHHCRTGRVRRAFSSRLRIGRVLSQRPKAGKRLAGGTRVNLVVSRGRRR